ncbi:DUF6048 family protein [Apibacter sp. HY039]|uniref:DUF6048 family protein n=1 Tax=Apibacter sp. HY039 TaxID=2501476 RepID=UPI000FEB8FF6|nr:DUF6048 family protein [Apibacter sp. HY039]
MNRKTYLLLISLFLGVFSYSQQPTIDSTFIIPKQRQMFVGVDLFNPIASFFSDKKNISGYISYKIKNRWLAVGELGYEKNIYKYNDWDVSAKGVFAEFGVNYILTNNYENTGEGFFIGARFAFSPYKQTINQYPVKGVNSDGQTQIISSSSLPEKNVSSGWFEGLVGAKVQLGQSPFYLDFMIRPKFLIFSNKQEGIDNLVIPGYGKNKGNANISLFWGVSYRIF